MYGVLTRPEPQINSTVRTDQADKAVTLFYQLTELRWQVSISPALPAHAYPVLKLTADYFRHNPHWAYANTMVDNSWEYCEEVRELLLDYINNCLRILCLVVATDSSLEA